MSTSLSLSTGFTSDSEPPVICICDKSGLWIKWGLLGVGGGKSRNEGTWLEQSVSSDSGAAAIAAPGQC